MPTAVFLGEFEQLVLLMLLKIEDEPYALRLREELNRVAGRNVSRGALYRTLSRLQEKGYVSVRQETSGPERSGYLRRRFRVTATGKRKLRASRQTLLRIWQEVSEALQ